MAIKLCDNYLILQIQQVQVLPPETAIVFQMAKLWLTQQWWSYGRCYCNVRSIKFCSLDILVFLQEYENRDVFRPIITKLTHTCFDNESPVIVDENVFTCSYSEANIATSSIKVTALTDFGSEYDVAVSSSMFPLSFGCMWLIVFSAHFSFLLGYKQDFIRG